MSTGPKVQARHTRAPLEARLEARVPVPAGWRSWGCGGGEVPVDAADGTGLGRCAVRKLRADGGSSSSAGRGGQPPAAAAGWGGR